jgi:hypothetical protein
LVITLVLAIIRAAVTLIMAMVMVVVAAVAIVVASFFVIVVMTTLGAIGASSLLGFLGIGIAICYLY